MNKETVERAAAFIALQRSEWSVDGKLIRPTLEDVEEVLDRLCQSLYDREDSTQIETGGIIVKKNGDHLDTYIHIGEL